MTSCSHTSDEARKWVESLSDRWRLQILSRRFRLDRKTGKRTELPVRIRRFVEGCPWSLVDAAVKHLLSLAPYKGVVYNGVPIDGEYVPTLTTWKRDDQDEVESPTAARRNDGTYTLVQDLVESGSFDSYSTGSSSSCMEEVVSEWRWDEGSIEDVPAGSQGVTYAVQAVSRNEDGTFDYAIVKRTAKTVGGTWAVQKDDATQKVEVAVWDDVYGEPGSFEADIPKAGTSGGKETVLSWTMNNDCTWRVQATRTTRKAVKSDEGCRKDIFKHEHVEGRSGQSAPLGDAPAASGGKVTRHDSRHQDDGTYENRTTVEQELPVSGASVEIRVGRKGVRRTTVDRNQPAPVTGTTPAVGGSVKSDRTPGGLYDNTVSTWIKSALAKVASVCRLDIFSHRHETTHAGGDTVDASDVPAAGGGVVHTRRSEMDDEGAVSNTDIVETELPVKGARESWAVTARGVRHSVTDRNVPIDRTAPGWSADKIGTTKTVEVTPGNLANITVEQFDRTGRKLKVGTSCEKTVFEHTHSDTEVDPAGSVPGHVADAGGGTRRRVESTVDENTGAVTTRTTETTEIQQDNGTQGSQDKLTKTDVVSTVNGGPAGSIPAIGSVRSSMTPAGKYNTTVETVTPKTVEGGGEEKDKLHSTKIEITRNAPSAKTSAPGAIGSARSTPTAHGFDVTTELITPVQATATGGESDALHSSVIETVRNASGVPGVPQLGSVRAQPTAYGFDYTRETITVKSGVAARASINTKYFKAEAVAFSNYDPNSVSSLVQQLGSAVSGWATVGDGVVPSMHFSFSMHLNRYGKVEGSAVATCSIPLTAGMSKVVASVYWIQNQTQFSPVMGQGNTLAGIIKSERVSTVLFATGFGAAALKDVVGSRNHSPGTHVTYNPYTGGWSASCVWQANPTVTFSPA